MKYNITRDANGESVIEEQAPPPPSEVRKARSGSRSDNQLPFRLRMALKSLSQPFIPACLCLWVFLFFSSASPLNNFHNHFQFRVCITNRIIFANFHVLFVYSGPPSWSYPLLPTPLISLGGHNKSWLEWISKTHILPPPPNGRQRIYYLT